MPKACCVIIGDIHFTHPALELASASLHLALDKAFELGVPLIINGDTLDSKAIIRAECANRLIEILSKRPDHMERVYINTGNHDLCNSAGTESSLNFLHPYAQVISHPIFIPAIKAWILPYFHETERLQQVLRGIKKGATLIIHQGIQGSDMGHYVLDKTSLPPEAFDGFRVVASHYHKRQTIKCGKTGVLDYISNPYTLGFGEATHPEKGFQVLMDDGSLEFVPTNLRKHRVLHWELDGPSGPHNEVGIDDLVWVKVFGPRSEVEKTQKYAVQRYFELPHLNFKLDLIPTDDETAPKMETPQTQEQILDGIIDCSGETDIGKAELKQLWRELV